MIDGLKPYPVYKDSGAPWLDRVPDHWDVTRSRNLLREVDTRSKTGEETHLSMSQRLGLVPSSAIEEKRLVSESYVGAKLCELDDLVLNRLKAHLGVFARASQPGLVSPDYTVLRSVSNSATIAFLEYVLRSLPCRTELRTRAKGLVEGFWRLYTDDFYQIKLPVPPVSEQNAIVPIPRSRRQTDPAIHPNEEEADRTAERAEAGCHPPRCYTWPEFGRTAQTFRSPVAGRDSAALGRMAARTFRSHWQWIYTVAR